MFPSECLIVSIPSASSSFGVLFWLLLLVGGGGVCFSLFGVFSALIVISVMLIAEKQQKEKLKRWELHYNKKGILSTCSFQLISFSSFTYI